MQAVIYIVRQKGIFHGFHTRLETILSINTFIHTSRHLRHLRHCANLVKPYKNTIFYSIGVIGAMAQVAQVAQSVYKYVNSISVFLYNP